MALCVAAKSISSDLIGGERCHRVLTIEMKRTLAWFGLFLFIAGILLVPALHAVQVDGQNCCDHGNADSGSANTGTQDRDDSGHDADHCHTCQLAHTPIAVGGFGVVLLQATALCGSAYQSTEAPTLARQRRIHASRAPPSHS